MSESSSPRLPFANGQLAILIVSGWAFWLAGAILCRVIGDAGGFAGAARLLVYAAVIPGTVPLVLIVRRLARLDDQQVALGIAIVTAAAIMLDGLALAWFPSIYGPGIGQTAASGAVILWGGAVAIALGCWFNRAPR